MPRMDGGSPASTQKTHKRRVSPRRGFTHLITAAREEGAVILAAGKASNRFSFLSLFFVFFSFFFSPKDKSWRRFGRNQRWAVGGGTVRGGAGYQGQPQVGTSPCFWCRFVVTSDRERGFASPKSNTKASTDKRGAEAAISGDLGRV